MNFVIVSHVVHKLQQDGIYAYEPYVREMNLWLKYVSQTTIIAPVTERIATPIETVYKHENIAVNAVRSIQFTSVLHVLKSVLALPKICFQIFKAFQKADHIHLRCPGNMGLLGCIIQVCFPKTPKTAKYAGNWDPKSKQPLSYRFQKWVLGNTFLTKNISVLVYGDWKNQSKNITPFFTASFTETDKVSFKGRSYAKALKFVFVGSLVKGKRPLIAIKIIEKLLKNNIDANLELYGDGVLRKELEVYVQKNRLSKNIHFKGNQPLDVVKQALLNAHFLILASKSEGWPKAVAEAMFFGVIPIATTVSCVAEMLGNGSRGILISLDLEKAVSKIMKIITENDLHVMSKLAQKWSQTYTLDYFEAEIKQLIYAPQ